MRQDQVQRDHQQQDSRQQDSRWTYGARDRLAELWTDGWSAAQIGEEFGKSRNAVISAIHRLGLAAVRPQHALPRVVKTKQKRSERHNSLRLSLAHKRRLIAQGRALPGVENFVDAASLTSDIFSLDDAPWHVRLFDLQPEHCRWPLGDPLSHSLLFCGAEKDPGSSYCAQHRAIAFYGKRAAASLTEALRNA